MLLLWLLFLFREQVSLGAALPRVAETAGEIVEEMGGCAYGDLELRARSDVNLHM